MDNAVRIGIDGTPMLGPRSGIGYYTSRLLSSMVELTPDWEYLLYSNRPLGTLEPPLDRATQVNGYFPHSRWMWMQAILPRTIRASQPSLCHFPNALAPLWQPTPFILTIHDASLFLFGGYHPRARHATIRLMLPFVARRAAAVITVSQHARQDLLRVLKLPDEKVHVVHEAAPEHFRPVEDPIELENIRQRYQLPQEFLLYVGTLEPRKNLVRVVHALHQVRCAGLPHKLVIAGPRGWMMDDFEREVQAAGLQDAVQYLGYIPTHHLPGLYSLATVFVFPSLYEGFGLPPLEAMACGTPVLSSNRSSLLEVCGDAAYLVDPESVMNIADGIICLLKDGNLRQELSARGLARARQFSWQRAAEQTLDVYRQVIDGDST